MTRLRGSAGCTAATKLDLPVVGYACGLLVEAPQDLMARFFMATYLNFVIEIIFFEEPAIGEIQLAYQ